MLLGSSGSMRQRFVNGGYQYITHYQPNLDQLTKDKIKYGLESLYILITKLVFIFFVAWILNIALEVLIFLFLYNIIRTTSFGLHATKSWICLVSSTLIFILIPIMCLNVDIPINIKTILGVIGIIYMMKYAPADTYKRPIINPKRRLIYKVLSTIIAFSLTIASIMLENSFWANCCIMALVIQCFMISPFVYKMFKLPYNNYLKYQYS